MNTKNKDKKHYIDPPSGWKYGFPKIIPESILKGSQEDFKNWLKDNGYPEKDLDLACKYSKYWDE